MKLEMTKRNLDVLSGKDRITIEDSLNFIYDFYQEIKRETGISLDAEPSRDVDELFRRLPWIGRFFSHVVDNNIENVRLPERRERLEKTQARLREKNTEIARAEEEIRDQQELIRDLKDRERELRVKNQRIVTLREDCRELEDRITGLSQIDLPREEQRKADLEKEREGLEASISDLQDRILGVRQECEGKKAEINEKKGSLESWQRNLGTLKSQIEQIDGEILENRAGYEKQKKQYTVLAQILEESGKKKTEMDTRVSEMDAEYARMQEEIRLLRQDIESRDFSGQKAKLTAIIEEQQNKQNEYEENKRKISELSRQLDQVKKDVEAQVKEQQAVNQRISQENLRGAEKINELKKKMAGLELQKENCIREAEDYRSRVESLEAWFESLEAGQYVERAQILARRFKMLGELKEKIEADWNSIWRKNHLDDRQVSEDYGQVLRGGLDEIGKELLTYQKDLRMIIEALSSEDCRT